MLDNFTLKTNLKGRKQNSEKKAKSSAFVTQNNINFLIKKTRSLFEKRVPITEPNITVTDLDNFSIDVFKSSDRVTCQWKPSIDRLSDGIFMINNMCGTNHVGVNPYLDNVYKKLLKKKKIYKITARLIMMCNINNRLGGIPNSVVYSQVDGVVWFETNGAPLSG